jgi:pimeloyl-ACP methyl ester carboxylesterase
VTRSVFYLHGFASSPRSTKAAFFERRLAAHGLVLQCPDLNEPDFESLTVTRMIAQVEDAIVATPESRTVLIGSSLGALVAVELAAKWAKRCAGGVRGVVSGHAIDRLVLLAPALDFAHNREHHLGTESIRRWKETGVWPVEHPADGSVRHVRFDLFEDALTYDPFGERLDLPILIFQGRRDEAVDPASVEVFARSRPQVTVHLLEDDHRLHASLEAIWRETARFLDLPEPR